MQTFENKVNAHWFIHNDATNETKRFAAMYETRLYDYVNIEVIKFLDNDNWTENLKRIKPFEIK